MPLFHGIEWADFQCMADCLKAETKTIPKNGIVLLAGEKPLYIGAVLSGRLHIVEENYDGDRTLISAVAPGEVFAPRMEPALRDRLMDGWRSAVRRACMPQ